MHQEDASAIVWIFRIHSEPPVEGDSEQFNAHELLALPLSPMVSLERTFSFEQHKEHDGPIS